MNTRERGSHSAASSSLGYFYQCRYALLEALRRLPDENPISVSIETVDDVVFEKAGSPPAILQTKHHMLAAGNPCQHVAGSLENPARMDQRADLRRLCACSALPDHHFRMCRRQRRSVPPPRNP